MTPFGRAVFTIVLIGSVALAGMRLAGGSVALVPGQALRLARGRRAAYL